MLSNIVENHVAIASTAGSGSLSMCAHRHVHRDARARTAYDMRAEPRSTVRKPLCGCVGSARAFFVTGGAAASAGRRSAAACGDAANRGCAASAGAGSGPGAAGFGREEAENQTRGLPP